MNAAPRVSDAALWCGGIYHGPNPELYRVWRNDSREVCPGDAFVALKGESSDGHLYVHKALERGASILLIDEKHAAEIDVSNPQFTGVSVLVVRDTMTALAEIAAKYLEALSPTVIGITGSVGKTTTRELAASVLKSKYKVHSAIRSFNTVIGCSLTILAMPQDTEILMLEYGTNHFGEIEEIVSYFPPDFAVITEVAPAHLDGFGDIAGVLRAKMEICSAKKLKRLVYNADNEPLSRAVGRYCRHTELVGVGFSSSQVKILNVSVRLEDAGAHTSAEYDLMGARAKAEAAVFGVQHAYNIGYALAIGESFGIGKEEAAEALRGFRPLSGRGVIKKVNDSAWVVDEAYNASPKSMQAAIVNVKNISGARDYKIYAVLGGMREMGESSSEWHNQLAGEFKGFEKVLLFGTEWIAKGVTLPENAVYCRSMEETVEEAMSLEMENAIVLVKGSNSYGLKKIVTLLTEGVNVWS